MPKAFWKGVISFGLVVIPVHLSVATDARRLAFRVLHKKCLTRPKEVWFCPVDDEYFGSEETVKGYEYSRGQYLVMDEGDFNKVPVSTTHSIEIAGFAGVAEVDPLYYRDAYYLEPEELGMKPFALFRETLVRTGRVGIAKVSFQKREHLCTLRPLGQILALHTMYYQDEVRPLAAPAAKEQKLLAAELEMAATLVKTMARPFKPEDYRDEYRLALEKVIQAKLKGEEIKAPKAPRVEAGADLMAALTASLAVAKHKTREKVAV